MNYVLFIVFIVLSLSPGRYLGQVEYNGQTFIELQDLLNGFQDPHVMDIKMGTRTFLECEVLNTEARQDLYEKVSKFSYASSDDIDDLMAIVM